MFLAPPLSGPLPRRHRYFWIGIAALFFLLLLSLLLEPRSASGAQVTISPSKDNTLFQLGGTLSNGAGEYLFTGETSDGLFHRAVIRFDVAAVIPAGSVINSVTLQMHVSRVKNQTLRVTALHRLVADWGEGTSNAGQNEGQGAPATTGDATWTHRFYPTTTWGTPGGDFSPVVSGSVLISGTGTYTWASAAGTVSDVQFWLDSPANNFGWLIQGDETVIETAKRLDSRENGTTANRPQLVVDYTPPGGTGACCYAGTCGVMTAAACASLSGTYQGDGTVCTPNPCPPPGTTITAGSIADNTLYESTTGVLSNGLGTKVVVSRSSSVIKRALVSFDLSAIPAGSTIQNVTLRLANAENATATTSVTVHRVTASWGEGTSTATGTEETGAASTTGDATWIHRFYPATNWAAAGGDFVASASATLSVAGSGTYSWSSAGLVADVQYWIDHPTARFGWILRGKETSGGSAVKRFESRQSTDVANRPALVITYVAPPAEATGACCTGTGICTIKTLAECQAANGTYQGDNTTCTADLCPVVLTPYVDALPVPAVAVPVSGTVGGAAEYVMPIREVWQKLHRDLPATRVWGYNGSYPGPTIVAASEAPVRVTWWNDLRDTTGTLRTTHYLPVDLCLSGPDVEGATPRVVTHLHGGHVPFASDGYPVNTILPGQQQVVDYPNHQQAGTLWYHDHAMGITRLNVMMGLAGFYLLRDPVETSLGLPAGEFELGLAIQDRSFHADGSLKYPATWDEHFEGDVMLVNGKVWPYLQVKPGKYRFHLLNGCNSRILRLSLSNGAPFTVIGDELGLLSAPVARETLLIANGERYDVVVDFSAYAPGTQIVLANDAPAMFPGTPGVGVIPNVMRFDVVAGAAYTAPLPAALRPVARIDTLESTVTRDFTLAKMANACTGTMWSINGLTFDDVTEFPVLGNTEIWRFINDSGISHPMHMHLVQFQVVDRQPFTRVSGAIVPTGPPVPPAASEAGWKDTAPVAPKEILRVIARFEDYAGNYAYHCHILEHEDHEMMRQFQTVAPPLVSIRDTTAAENGTMRFAVALSADVPVEVRVTATTEDGSAHAGSDYTATTQQLIFAPHVTTQLFTVPLVDDADPELAESFAVRLTGRVNALPGDTLATGGIVDDDGTTAVGEPVPAVSFLGKSAPNPSVGTSTIRWGLSAPAVVDLAIFDLQGRSVRRLARGAESAGFKTSRWDGRDDHGARVAAGFYLIRLRIGAREFIGRVQRLR